jgi:hypothetical protein
MKAATAAEAALAAACDTTSGRGWKLPLWLGAGANWGRRAVADIGTGGYASSSVVGSIMMDLLRGPPNSRLPLALELPRLESGRPTKGGGPGSDQIWGHIGLLSLGRPKDPIGEKGVALEVSTGFGDSTGCPMLRPDRGSRTLPG